MIQKWVKQAEEAGVTPVKYDYEEVISILPALPSETSVA